jgi:hypothetical protein
MSEGDQYLCLDDVGATYSESCNYGIEHLSCAGMTGLCLWNRGSYNTIGCPDQYKYNPAWSSCHL